MRILSNAFPTNLPNSEAISQGGPANFAKLFVQYIADTNAPHEWVGVMLEAMPDPSAVRLQAVFKTAQRSYHRLRVPKSMINSVTKSQDNTDDAAVLWAKPIARLERFIREQRPDVVFLNGFGILNWMLLKAARGAGVPVVTQHAGIWTKELRLHRARYSEHGRRMMEGMERESSELSSVEVFLNWWSRDYYRTHVAFGPLRTSEVVPLPFNFYSFEKLSAGEKPVRFGFDRKKRHIGIIARWDEIKNHAAVLAMAKAASQKKLPWQFHAVVDIPAQYADEKAAYERYVDVVAPLDRAGISEFCRSVDLLMLPSLFDVSPTVVLEAIALDTPIVISSTVGFVRDFVSSDAAAWIIDPADTAAAVQSIAKIMGKEMPAELKERILKKHDHRAVFAEYLQLFEEAHLRELPLLEVIKLLWWQEWARLMPWFKTSRSLARKTANV